jgi:hypothetical protein
LRLKDKKFAVLSKISVTDLRRIDRAVYMMHDNKWMEEKVKINNHSARNK